MSVSYTHILSYVKCWLEIAVGMSSRNFYKVGIKLKDVKNECKRSVNLMENGQRSVEMPFQSHKGGVSQVIMVVVSLLSILNLMKYSHCDPMFHTMCKSLVEIDMQKYQEQQDSFISSQVPISFVDCNLEDESHCFTLPFKTTNADLVLVDNQSSSLLRARTSMPHGEYFENSLQDTIGRDYIIVNGSDINSVKSRHGLSVGIVHFWMKWLVTPRTANDIVKFQVYAASPLLLTGVLSDVYTPSLQKLLHGVNIFEKKLVMFPVYAGQHWSLIAVFNPINIIQTSMRWKDEKHTRDVTAIVHLDSMSSNTPHDRYKLSHAVWKILNKEWEIHCNTSLDKMSLPFFQRRDACRLHSMIGEYCIGCSECVTIVIIRYHLNLIVIIYF